jgi:Uma2 family endonuclease
MGSKTMIPVEEFDRLTEPDEVRYELDHGELIEMTRPRYEPHNRIVMTIARGLLGWLAGNPIGEVLMSDNLFVLGPNTKRAPDLSFMTLERIRRIQPGRDIDGAPDLAIEVLSPSDAEAAVRRKVKQYFDAGAQMVWLVFPDRRTIEVCRPDAAVVVLREPESLDAPELLPGFSMVVSTLFSKNRFLWSRLAGSHVLGDFDAEDGERLVQLLAEIVGHP